MSQKKVQHKTNDIPDNPIPAPAQKKLRLIRCATGFANIANREGDMISVTPDLEAQLIAEGYAELI